MAAQGPLGHAVRERVAHAVVRQVPGRQARRRRHVLPQVDAVEVLEVQAQALPPLPRRRAAGGGGRAGLRRVVGDSRARAVGVAEEGGLEPAFPTLLSAAVHPTVSRTFVEDCLVNTWNHQRA